MAELPAGLSCLTALTHMVASHNQLQALPPVAALARLAVLELHHNKLQGLPPGVDLLPLQALDVADNVLAAWPWGYQPPASCECLHVHVLS